MLEETRLAVVKHEVLQTLMDVVGLSEAVASFFPIDDAVCDLADVTRSTI